VTSTDGKRIVRDDYALGISGRARGVDDGRDVIATLLDPQLGQGIGLLHAMGATLLLQRRQRHHPAFATRRSRYSSALPSH
jgi:hypothetical protein